METQSQWDADSRSTQFRTSEGTTGQIERQDYGDFYAGKDGQVYKRDENGWHQHGEDGWNPVEVPDERAAQIDQQRESASERRQSTERPRSAEGPARSKAPATLSSGGFAQSSGGGGLSGRTYDSSRYSGSFDSSRRNELNHSYSARTNGYQRYNNRNSMNRQSMGGRSMQRRRR
jgi:hypothetical protein